MELEFKRLHDGCSHEDLFKLMDIDCLRNMVYIFNGATRSVAHPTGNEVPWTVLLLLGGYNRKHRFCSRRNPDLVQFSRDVSNIEQLVLRAWGIFINDKDQGPASVPPEVRATAPDMQRKAGGLSCSCSHGNSWEAQVVLQCIQSGATCSTMASAK